MHNDTKTYKLGVVFKMSSNVSKDIFVSNSCTSDELLQHCKEIAEKATNHHIKQDYEKIISVINLSIEHNGRIIESKTYGGLNRLMLTFEFDSESSLVLFEFYTKHPD